jgi:hypothetical protein
MAYTSIDDPSAHHQSVTWAGTGSAGNAITFNGNSDMQPDLVWSKRRDVGYNHVLKTTSVGGTSDNDIHVVPNSTNAQSTYSNYRMDFNSDGFTADAQGDQGFQVSGSSMVSWAWKANGGTTSSNTDGSITSTVQANTDAGFSIVTYTGDNTSAQTVGHGLGAVPHTIWVKRLNSNNRNWAIYHQEIGNTGYLQFNSTDTVATNSAYWNNTSPTSSVFTVGTGNNSRVNAGDLLAFCFTEKQGYSKFGKYTGNGNVNGPFIYTGFKPAFILIRTNSGFKNWYMWDNTRSPINPVDESISITDSAELTGYDPIDIVSNGFKLKDADATWNSNATTTYYWAFAESPFVTSTGIPTTAR